VAYKSILTYVDRHRGTKAQIANAIRLAKHHDATLTIISYAANVLPPQRDFGEAAKSVVTDVYEKATSAATINAADVRADCTAAGISFSIETFVSLNDEWGDEFGRHARYCDLVVLGPINDETSKRTASDALEAALYTGDVPVMVCPSDMRSTAPETVLIGWNGSREALRSVRAAMPLLCDATAVDIAIVDQAISEKASAENLARLLARHGVDASVSPLTRNLRTVDETLRSQAADIGAGLIVMGAYSHSWFREYFLGGVTQQLITRPPVPVFLAH